VKSIRDYYQLKLILILLDEALILANEEVDQVFVAALSM